MTSSRKRPRSDDIAEDRKSLIGIRSLPDYAPRNEACTAPRLTALQQAMEAATETVIHIRQGLTTARDDEAATIRAFHEGILLAKTEVIAQYGADSGVVQLMGLKRKSDRRRRKSRPDAAAAEKAEKAEKAKASQTDET
jgi:hypothetical protein